MDEKREFVNDDLETINTYDLTGKLDEVAEKFIKTIYRLKKEYADKYLSLEIDYKQERYSDDYSFFLKGKRLESDAEYNARIEQQKKQKEWRREQYKSLKKEFEGE